jgi:hypothetical protein
MGQLEGIQSTRQKFQEFLTGSHPGNNSLDLMALRRGLGVFFRLPDGAMHVQAVLYRTTRIKTL